MSRRWNTNTRRRIYAALATRDGEKCALCGSSPPAVRLEIDHVNGDHKDSRLVNLRLLCVSCNRAEGNRRRSPKTGPKQPPIIGGSHGTKHVPSDSSQGNKELESSSIRGLDRTAEVRRVVDFQAGSPEMAANDLYELHYREWVLSELCAGRRLTKKEAIYEGAETTGCSPKSSRDYLEKMASRAGPVQEIRESNGMKIIVTRTPDVQG